MKLSQLFLLLFLLFPGCDYGSDSAIPSSSTEAAEIRKTFTLGGAPIKVDLILSPKELSILDILVVKIRVESSPDIKLNPPYLKKEVYLPLNLIAPPAYSSRWNGDNTKLIQEWIYQFEPLNSGTNSLQAFDLNFRLLSEKVDDQSNWPLYTITTEPVTYLVTSVDVKNVEQIKPIKGPLPAEFNYLPLALAIFGLFGVLSLGHLYLRRGRLGKELVSQLPDTPDYYLETMLALDHLEQQDLIAQAQFEELHIRLSTILRSYLENYFGIPAQEQTTEEFLREISESDRFTLEEKEALDRFLHLTDLVKFASFNPGDTRSITALESVRSFVQATGGTDEI